MLKRIATIMLLSEALLTSAERFEIASIKPAEFAPAGPNTDLAPERGVFSCSACSTLQILSFAFGFVRPDVFVFQNGTNKASNTIVYANAKGAPCSRDVLVERMKTLLVERFGLQYSLTQEPAPIYELTASKYDPKKPPVATNSVVKSMPLEFIPLLLADKMNAIIVDKTGLANTDMIQYTGNLADGGNVGFLAAIEALGFQLKKAGTGMKIKKVVITALTTPSEN